MQIWGLFYGIDQLCTHSDPPYSFIPPTSLPHFHFHPCMADCCPYCCGVPYPGFPCYHWNYPCQSHIYPTSETALHDHIAIPIAISVDLLSTLIVTSHMILITHCSCIPVLFAMCAVSVFLSIQYHYDCIASSL